MWLESVNHSVVSNSFWLYRLKPARLLCPWDSLGKDTGVGCCTLLQGIFPTQGSNPCLHRLLHCRRFLYHLATKEAPVALNHTNLLSYSSESHKSKINLTELKSRYWQGWFLWKFPRESVSLSVSAPGATCIPWLLAASSEHSRLLLLLSHLLLLILFLLPSSSKNPCELLGLPTWPRIISPSQDL